MSYTIGNLNRLQLEKQKSDVWPEGGNKNFKQLKLLFFLLFMNFFSLYNYYHYFTQKLHFRKYYYMHERHILCI